MNYYEFSNILSTLKEKSSKLLELERDATVDDSEIKKYEEFFDLRFPESYEAFLKNYGGGYLGYTLVYSLDNNGIFNIKNRVSSKMINDLHMLPVIDLETGDLIGFEVNEKKCTEDLVFWNHETGIKRRLHKDFFETLVSLGVNNDLEIE